MSIFSVNFTFAYWHGLILFLEESVNVNDEVTIGDWDPSMRLLRVHDNLSQSFDSFTIEVPPYAVLGDDFYDYFDFISLPKDHPGVDLSLYTFDNWHTSNRTVFDRNTVASTSLDIYPSRNVNSSAFTYTLSSGMYDILKASSFNLKGDLYIPGWRYIGRQINILGSYHQKFTNYNFAGSVTIGEGIRKIYTTTFSGTTMTSLTLEEGLEEVQTSAF